MNNITHHSFIEQIFTEYQLDTEIQQKMKQILKFYPQEAYILIERKG